MPTCKANRNHLFYWVTVSEVVPAVPPSDALIVVVPTETGTANPVVLTVATDVALEFQPAELVTLPTEPSENVADAVNCCC